MTWKRWHARIEDVEPFIVTWRDGDRSSRRRTILTSTIGKDPTADIIRNDSA